MPEDVAAAAAPPPILNDLDISRLKQRVARMDDVELIWMLLMGFKLVGAPDIRSSENLGIALRTVTLEAAARWFPPRAVSEAFRLLGEDDKWESFLARHPELSDSATATANA